MLPSRKLWRVVQAGAPQSMMVADAWAKAQLPPTEWVKTKEFDALAVGTQEHVLWPQLPVHQAKCMAFSNRLRHLGKPVEPLH